MRTRLELKATLLHVLLLLAVCTPCTCNLNPHPLPPEALASDDAGKFGGDDTTGSGSSSGSSGSSGSGGSGGSVSTPSDDAGPPADSRDASSPVDSAPGPTDSGAADGGASDASPFDASPDGGGTDGAAPDASGT